MRVCVCVCVFECVIEGDFNANTELVASAHGHYKGCQKLSVLVTDGFSLSLVHSLPESVFSGHLVK